ncbi:MAG: hypothetical protein EBZ51_08230 [Synechococcaceae bacterium WB9_2_112]|nr:hypothetical protein [Synechococcaceae bacterium WB9_2_112]
MGCGGRADQQVVVAATHQAAALGSGEHIGAIKAESIVLAFHGPAEAHHIIATTTDHLQGFGLDALESEVAAGSIELHQRGPQGGNAGGVHQHKRPFGGGGHKPGGIGGTHFHAAVA